MDQYNGVGLHLGWGEGEMKFYLDGDQAYPTICGTGNEDYFCGAYGFGLPEKDGEKSIPYTTPYACMPHIIWLDGNFLSQTRFGLYRWHIMDPVRFERDIRVTIQALGWRTGRRYLPLQDDLPSVAYWYQTLPIEHFPKLPDRDVLEII